MEHFTDEQKIILLQGKYDSLKEESEQWENITGMASVFVKHAMQGLKEDPKDEELAKALFNQTEYLFAGKNYLKHLYEEMDNVKKEMNTLKKGSA